MYLMEYVSDIKVALLKRWRILVKVLGARVEHLFLELLVLLI